MTTYVNHDGTRAPHPFSDVVPEYQHDDPPKTSMLSHLLHILPKAIADADKPPSKFKSERGRVGGDIAAARAAEQSAKVRDDILVLLRTCGPMRTEDIAPRVTYLRGDTVHCYQSRGLQNPLSVLKTRGLIERVWENHIPYGRAL